MAEFCLDCWNELNNTQDPPEKYVYSWGLDLCEGCGEWKHVIVVERRCVLTQILFGLYYRIRNRRK